MSTYGNWAYQWFAFGKNFRNFISTVDDGYLIGKLTMGQKNVYDSESTLQEVKKSILYHRRKGDWTKEKARQEWGLLSSYNDLYDSGDFGEWLRETSIECAYEDYRSMPNPQVVMFTQRLWPVFIKALAENPLKARRLPGRGHPPRCRGCT